MTGLLAEKTFSDLLLQAEIKDAIMKLNQQQMSGSFADKKTYATIRFTRL